MKTGMPGSRMAATKAQREPEGLMIPAGPDQAPMRQAYPGTGLRCGVPPANPQSPGST